MQTESLLTDLDRARLDRWAGSLDQNKIYWHRGQQLAEIARPIVGELSRLEQENQRLDYDKRGLEECLKACRYERDTTRAALDAARAEVQRLRTELEKGQSTRAEWQRAIDHLEEENARLRNTLRLSLILSEPGQADRVLERIATLEGRIQGITEAAKERLDSHDFRIRALEANRWAGPNVPYLASDLPPFNSGYVDGNPNAEDLLPKGELR